MSHEIECTSWNHLSQETRSNAPHTAKKDIPIYDQDHTKPNKNDTVILRKGCWIGARSTILKGVEVGRNAVVAAGSVVTRDVEDHTLVAGIPAKILKKI